MTNATSRRACGLAVLALGLLVGCGAPPHPRGPLTSGDIQRIAKVMASKLQPHTQRGWPDEVVMQGRLPLLRTGAFENRSDADVDGQALLLRLAWELEQLQVVLYDQERGALVLDVKIDPLLDAGRELLTVSAFVNGGNTTLAAGTELER